MKSIALLGLAVLCSGCTTTTSTTSANRTEHRAIGESRVYTQRDLRATGQTDIGPALETLDPSVEASHP